MATISPETRVPFREGALILPADPLVAFQAWLNDAVASGAAEPTSMTLATASKAGRPNARIVLFKGTSLSPALGSTGIEFYTNYESQKSRELFENPFAALVFHWPTLRRQIRFSGPVEKMTPAESNGYFQTRSRGSRIGAWSSPQSQKITERSELEKRVVETTKRFGEGEIPCPENWGGWRLVPERAEFWEERPSRLHERQEFTKEASGEWVRSQLAP
jgi:pyridoxamine 5'-phosphate oxidase